MKKQTFQRILCWLLVLCMVLPVFPTARAASVSWTKTDLQLQPQRDDRLVRQESGAEREPDEMVRVSIVLEEPSTVEAGYATMGISSNTQAMSYRARLQQNQKRMEQTISNRVLGGKRLDVVWNMTLVANIISAWVPYGRIGEIEALPGVRTVAMEAQYEPCVTQRAESVQPDAYASTTMTGASLLWNGGYTGAGSRIAVIDTGTDTDHQSMDNGAYLYALQENARAKGMTMEAYLDSLNLLTVEEIARVLPELNLYAMNPTVRASDLYGNEKLAFGYNYVDNNLNINHHGDYQGEHGSHVAGIATANRYIPQDGGYVDARESVLMLGVAPDAQLLTMKVFGEESPFDSDYMAAIEDAILLGCDAVNLSMGTAAPGSPYTNVYSELMEMMTHTDTVVVISAGNAANWAAASVNSYLYHDDVSLDMVGAPGSYTSAFTVASVDNDGSVGHYFTANGCNAFYAETLGFGNAPMAEMDYNGTGTEYDYIFLDGLGYPEEYAGINVAGKIVMVSRGTLSFAEKANNALSRGAAAVVVYNNQPGISNMDLTGLGSYAPVVSITQAESAAIRAASENRGKYLTGKITVYARMGLGQSGAEYYTMSDFSSWGVPGDLSLKPEITAPGGGIYSLWGSNAVTGGGTDQYRFMSGTSMAAPQVTGMTALLAQVYREQGLAEKSGLSARHLAQSLLMSTAEPLFEADSGGNYYSLMSQGAGLARVDLASQAQSFVLVEGQNDGKVKAELGDDPQRTGIYTFKFTIHNLTDKPAAYALDSDLFRQDVFEGYSGNWMLDTWTTALDGVATFASAAMSGGSGAGHDLNGDGVTDAADADFLLEYLLGNETVLYAAGDVSGDGVISSYDAHLLLAQLSGDVVTVPAGGSAEVCVKLELTEEARALLDEKTPKGTYVQAFVYARALSDDEGSIGTTHSIPVLAFYGNWSDPTMFDRGTLLEHAYGVSDLTPYLYYVVGPYGNALAIDYGDGQEYYYGGNPILDDDTYLPQRNAFSSTNGSMLTEQTFSLIRSAGTAWVEITNADTGEVYFQRGLGELLPAYYNANSGYWENAVQYARLNWRGTDGYGKALAEGTKVNVSLTAVPEYYRDEDGIYSFDDLGGGATMTTSFVIDNTAPQIHNVDDSQVENGILTVTAVDNEYVAAVALLNATGTKMLAAQSPNQTRKAAEVRVELDVSAAFGKSFLVAVYDYAGNVSVYKIEMDLKGPERSYFTAINYNTGAYVSLDHVARMTEIASLDIPTTARAAEFAEGYVFTITTDRMLCVAADDDLSVTRRITQLDEANEWLVDSFADMAYNRVDGKMYALFYSGLNGSMVPYLCTIDLHNGDLDILCEMPVDVHTLAIDDSGNCYSAGWSSSSLYRYTVSDAMAGRVTYIGEMAYYATDSACCMAWDHEKDELYYCYPNTLLRINTANAEPTFLGYFVGQCIGLYIAQPVEASPFDPVDAVERVELSQNDTRVLLGSTLTLEADVWPWNASDRSVTWTTSDASVATVNAGGVITARSLGRCTITATSNLDPGKSASCTVEIFELEKTLQALVWDEDGAIWMSRFSTATLPEYTKLHSTELGKNLAAATVGQDGNLYAASLNPGTMKSELYKLDPVTYQPTRIGASTDAYMDLAPAPGQPGNSLMAVYGGNVLNVDADTGDYYNWYYMFANSLVGIAYVGTHAYTDWGFNTMVDWYFIIDRVGYVYLLGFLEQDGAFFYLEHDQLAPGGIYTKLDFEMDTPYFGSAYFDGEMLYFSAYKESRNDVTLMAIDVAGGTRACYTLGTFGDGVWPVAGLMEQGSLGGDIGLILSSSRPVPVEQQTELKGIGRESREGGLHTAVPMSHGGAEKEQVRLTVTMPADGTNGTMTVTYDPSVLVLENVCGRTDAFAWKLAEPGRVEIAFAEGAVRATGSAVADLDFRGLAAGTTTIFIHGGEWGSGTIEFTECIDLTLDFQIPHEHSYTATVTEPTCTDEGFTTYTCDCGDSFVTDRIPALGHDWQGGVCSRCGMEKSLFEDVSQGTFYYEPVIWAVENGITTGATDTTFNPDGVCMRGHVVTFLWRAMGSPEPATSVNPFVDVKETDYFYKAVLWAYENGITTGTDASHFSPTGECNRAQVVTFLWRAMGKPESNAQVTFSDVVDGQFYTTPVAWAVEHGITNGMGDGTFGVLSTCNRAQVVTFLYRTLN